MAELATPLLRTRNVPPRVCMSAHQHDIATPSAADYYDRVAETWDTTHAPSDRTRGLPARCSKP